MLKTLILTSAAGLLLAAQLSAQQPFLCSVNGGIPPFVRSEGLAEPIGQTMIICQGGTAPAPGVPVTDRADITIYLNSPYTGQILGKTATGQPITEAVLMVNEPEPAAQKLCPAGETCPISGAPTGQSNPYTSYNVWQGVQTNIATLTWYGVPIAQPGFPNLLILRIANIRTDMTMFAGTLPPPTYTVNVSITGATMPIPSPLAAVAHVAPGLSVTGTNLAKSTCGGVTAGQQVAQVTIGEMFATALAPNPASAKDQSLPGAIYNTESMFTNSTLIPKAGLATQGSRVLVRFLAAPRSAALSVPYQVDAGGGHLALVENASNTGDGGTITTQTSGLATLREGADGAPFAVYEYVSPSSPSATVSTFTVPVYAATAPRSACFGAMQIRGGYAPQSLQDGPATFGALPVPRFKPAR